MEKLEKFYRTRADFPDWMTEEEWNKKEIEIIKECLEPKIKQTMEELFNGIKCPLALSVEMMRKMVYRLIYIRKVKKRQRKTIILSDTYVGLDVLALL